MIGKIISRSCEGVILLPLWEGVNNLIYKALVSAHIYVDENGDKDIEVFDQVDNDKEHIDIFCDIDHALLEQIEIGDKKDHFFMAIVKSDFVKCEHWEGTEWDVEHEVTEIKSLDDINM